MIDSKSRSAFMGGGGVSANTKSPGLGVNLARSNLYRPVVGLCVTLINL